MRHDFSFMVRFGGSCALRAKIWNCFSAWRGKRHCSPQKSTHNKVSCINLSSSFGIKQAKRSSTSRVVKIQGHRFRKSLRGPNQFWLTPFKLFSLDFNHFEINLEFLHIFLVYCLAALVYQKYLSNFNYDMYKFYEFFFLIIFFRLCSTRIIML